MNIDYSEVVNIARDYYNSDDADNFYAVIWGGEDIHIGLYESPEDPILEASHRTVRHMADLLGELDGNHHVLDIGSGYGGAARHLASTYGCRVTALNLSEKENSRHREINRERGLDDRITVVDGSFESIPLDNASFDAVWSQDAILHSGHRAKVLQEVNRVLKPGGEFIFSDPMQADDCPEGVLNPVLARIHLDTMGSFIFYRNVARKLGWETLTLEDLTPHLPQHYKRVKEETEKRYEEMVKLCGKDYIDRMLQGLQHWVDAGKRGHLAWGILHFRKPAV